MRSNFGENRDFSGTGYSIIHTKEALVRASLIWCRRRDLNPHGLRHTPLKRACLPFHHFGNKRSLRRRGKHIIEVGQNPCQSIDGPVESGGSYSPGPSTLCRVTTSSLPRLMMSLSDGHKGPSQPCSTSTTRFFLERLARYDSSGFCGGAVWWDGVS